jgi:hypothetical protein
VAPLITAVTIAVLVFIFQGPPSGLTVLVIAIIVVEVLGLVEPGRHATAERVPAGLWTFRRRHLMTAYPTTTSPSRPGTKGSLDLALTALPGSPAGERP